MKVFIIGASGGVGFRAAQALKERGHAIGGLYRRPQRAERLTGIAWTRRQAT